MIYLPGTGIIAAYVDKETGELNNQFSQAIAMFVFAWFVLTMVFTVGAMRSSWVLFIALMFVDLHLLLIACGHLTGNNRLNVAGNSAGLVVAFLACEYPNPNKSIFRWRELTDRLHRLGRSGRVIYRTNAIRAASLRDCQSKLNDGGFGMSMSSGRAYQWYGSTKTRARKQAGKEAHQFETSSSPKLF